MSNKSLNNYIFSHRSHSKTVNATSAALVRKNSRVGSSMGRGWQPRLHEVLRSCAKGSTTHRKFAIGKVISVLDRSWSHRMREVLRLCTKNWPNAWDMHDWQTHMNCTTRTACAKNVAAGGSGWVDLGSPECPKCCACVQK